MNILNDISNFIFINTSLEKSDIIFIPGSPAGELAIKAASLYKDGYAPLLLPSGKYSIKGKSFILPHNYSYLNNKNINTEYDFLRSILIKEGVNKAHILKEDAATNTYENSLLCREVTDKNHLNIKKAIIVCKSYHARRCLMYYSLAYPETQFFICSIDYEDICKHTWYKSQKGIDTVLGELERCGLQFKDILKNKL